MHSIHLEQVLGEFLEQAAAALQAELRAGAEVPFDLAAGGSGRGAPALYCYRPLTGRFVAERMEMLERLPAHAGAVRALQAFDGLDRYVASTGSGPERTAAGRARAALVALLSDAFCEQSDFELHPERVRRALARLEQAAETEAGEAVILATLHGLTIVSPELRLTRGLVIARPEGLDGLPEGARGRDDGAAGHLVAVLALQDTEPERALAHGRAVLADLVRALRLFGDGRVCLGGLGWSRIGGGAWNAIALGGGGRPRGMLLVTPEQEDELRAFCNLVSRRSPDGDEVAWALRRFELACGRESAYEALSDNLLALRAMLEPEGPASGLLAGRLAALCATSDRRAELTERTLRATALERELIAGTASPHAGAESLADEIADHLRALLRDIICGHLGSDLAGLADEILLEDAPLPAASGEEVLGDLVQAQEVLDLSV